MVTSYTNDQNSCSHIQPLECEGRCKTLCVKMCWTMFIYQFDQMKASPKYFHILKQMLKYFVLGKSPQETLHNILCLALYFEYTTALLLLNSMKHYIGEWSSPTLHYRDVIMSTMASQRTVVLVVCSMGWSKKTSKLRVTGLCEGNYH